LNVTQYEFFEECNSLSLVVIEDHVFIEAYRGSNICSKLQSDISRLPVGN